MLVLLNLARSNSVCRHLMFMHTSVYVSFCDIGSSKSARAEGGSNQLSKAFICNKAASEQRFQ